MDGMIRDAASVISNSLAISIKIGEDVSEHLPFQIKKYASTYCVEVEGVNVIFLACSKTSTLSSNNFYS